MVQKIVDFLIGLVMPLVVFLAFLFLTDLSSQYFYNFLPPLVDYMENYAFEISGIILAAIDITILVFFWNQRRWLAYGVLVGIPVAVLYVGVSLRIQAS